VLPAHKQPKNLI